MYSITKLSFRQLAGSTHRLGLELELSPRNAVLESFLLADSQADESCKEFIDFLTSKEKEWGLNYTYLVKIDKQNVQITLAEGLDDLERSDTFNTEELIKLLSEWRVSPIRMRVLEFFETRRPKKSLLASARAKYRLPFSRS